MRPERLISSQKIPSPPPPPAKKKNKDWVNNQKQILSTKPCCNNFQAKRVTKLSVFLTDVFCQNIPVMFCLLIGGPASWGCDLQYHITSISPLERGTQFRCRVSSPQMPLPAELIKHVAQKQGGNPPRSQPSGTLGTQGQGYPEIRKMMQEEGVGLGGGDVDGRGFGLLSWRVVLYPSCNPFPPRTRAKEGHLGVELG